MGLLSWLFGNREAQSGGSASRAVAAGLAVPEGYEAVAWAKGDGTFPTEVVGESHYQAALEAVAGGKTFDGVDMIVTATLVPENNNPVDANAVCVKIGGRAVGYLSRSDAQQFRTQAATVIAQGLIVHCQANIRGGWNRGNGDQGSFGVWLDTGEE